MCVDADSTRLEQILVNLLTNAAKYTEPSGQLALSAESQGNQAVIRVADNGVGIPQEMLPRIFDLFTQVDRSIGRSEGGLGIGLTLVKRLVELHGGTVTAESQRNKGSVFTVRLPLHHAIANAIRPPQHHAASGNGKRVLIVDDNRDSATSLKIYLEIHGFNSLIVHDGKLAIEAARKYRPHAVLLDIGLPGLNGYDVARLLRQEEVCAGSLIIGVSGYGDESSREKGRNAGFDHHLTKPIDMDKVVNLVGQQS